MYSIWAIPSTLSEVSICNVKLSSAQLRVFHICLLFRMYSLLFPSKPVCTMYTLVQFGFQMWKISRRYQTFILKSCSDAGKENYNYIGLLVIPQTKKKIPTYMMYFCWVMEIHHGFSFKILSYSALIFSVAVVLKMFFELLSVITLFIQIDISESLANVFPNTQKDCRVSIRFSYFLVFKFFF